MAAAAAAAAATGAAATIGRRPATLLLCPLIDAMRPLDPVGAVQHARVPEKRENASKGLCSTLQWRPLAA